MNRKVAQMFSKESVSKQIDHPGFKLPCRADNGAVGMYVMKRGNKYVFANDSNGTIKFPTFELNISNCPFKTAPKAIKEAFKISIPESKWHRVAIVKRGQTLVHILVCDLDRNEINRNPVVLMPTDFSRVLSHGENTLVTLAGTLALASSNITMPTYIELECHPDTIDGAKGITKKFNVTPEVLEARKAAAIKRSATRRATEAKRKFEGRRNAVTMACREVEA